MRKHEINASRFGSQVAVQHAPAWIGLLGLSEHALEVANIAVHGHAEIALALVTDGNLVEGRLAVEAVDVAPKHAPLAGPKTLPDIGRGGVIDGARKLVEAQLA